MELARRAHQPDLSVGTSYNTTWATPEHRWAVEVLVNVPVWRRRRQAELVDQRERESEAEARLQALADDIRSHVQSAVVTFEATRASLEVIDERLLPTARDHVASSRSGFTAGTNDFLAVIEAERGLRTAELQHEIAVADLHGAVAELRHALGGLPSPFHAGDLP